MEVLGKLVSLFSQCPLSQRIEKIQRICLEFYLVSKTTLFDFYIVFHPHPACVCLFGRDTGIGTHPDPYADSHANAYTDECSNADTYLVTPRWCAAPATGRRFSLG
jgi:hypothetical protein